MKYAVEMLFIDRWQNSRKDDAGNPELFETRDQAEDAIKDHITDCINAVEGGDMEDSPDPSHFRIVPVGGTIEPFDAYEIHGCQTITEGGHTWVEQCSDDEAEFFTFYGHIPGRGVDAIGDFVSRELAEEILVRINPPAKAAAPEMLNSLRDILSRFRSCIAGGNGEIEGDKEAITKAAVLIARYIG